MSKIAVRGYTQKVKGSSGNPFFKPKDIPLRHDRVLVFDTETTTGQYQNFKIGFFQIYQEGYFQHEGLFYDSSMLADKEKLLTEETLHEKAQWTPYKNQKITGWPEMTMSRGEIIVQNDEFLGKKGWGLFI